jgi:hypothetical protein
LASRNHTKSVSDNIFKLLDAAKTDEDREFVLKLAKHALGKVPVEKEREEINWEKKIHKCPRCEKSGPVDPMFGTRIVRGVERLQSWCTDCRSKTNYHNKKHAYKED